MSIPQLCRVTIPQVEGDTSVFGVNPAGSPTKRGACEFRNVSEGASIIFEHGFVPVALRNVDITVASHTRNY